MAGQNVRELNSQQFQSEVLNGKTPVLVDFTAPWCGPCKTIEPTLDELAVQYQGKLQVVSINVDDNQEIAQQYRVMSMPTLLLFKDGKPVGQVIGAHREKIKELAAKAV